MQTKTNKQLQWLIDNHQFLSINAIAEEIGIPQRSLAAFVKGERPLNEKWHLSLTDWVKKFKK